MHQSIFRKGLLRFTVSSLFFLFVLQTLLAQSLLERIQSLPDVISVEKMEQNQFFNEAYVVNVKQPIDHKHPERGSFPQRVMLSHLAYDRPVVFVTEGYGGGYALDKRYLEELCPLLKANQLFAEHRYFGKSRPDSIDWAHLTVENAAADQHHIVEMFKKIYSQKWVSTGISKGGETALYHRMLYPDDVDVTVPFVAPLNFSVEEKRHPRFIEKKVGTKKERKLVRDFQLDVLQRKDRLMPMFEQLCKEKNFHFKAPQREIFDYSVLELSFSFWQWGHSVKGIPARSATDREVFDYYQKISSSDYFDIESGKANVAFFVQAHRQLGYYAYNTRPFKKVIETKNTKGYIERLFLQEDQIFPYNPEMSLETDRFLKTTANKVLLIYGAVDPWSASAATGGKNKGVVVLFQPGGSHRTRISNMPEPLKAQAINLLHDWMK